MKKFKNEFFRIAMIAVSLVMCFTFVSCGDNEDDNEPKPTSNSIVGTWKRIWGEDLRCDYTANTFFEDGTGIHFDKGNGAVRFTYVYNPETKVLTIRYSEYQQFEYVVETITSDYIEYDGKRYDKSELTKDMLILGEWFLHVGSEKVTRVMFRYDGTYEAKDYDSSSSDEFNSSFLGLSGKVSGTYSILGNNISIKGESQISGEYIIDGLVVNGLRFIKKETPDAYPYLIGGYNDR